MTDTIPPVLMFAGLLVIAMMVVAGANRAMWIALTVVFLALGIFFRSGPPGTAESATLAVDRGTSLALQSPPNDLVEAIVAPEGGRTPGAGRPAELSLPSSTPNEFATTVAPTPSSTPAPSSKPGPRESLVEAIITPK
jgi:hypothetical protein